MLVSVCPPDTVNVVYVTCSLHVNFQRWLMSSGWGWVPSETCVSLCNHRLAQPAVIIVFHGQWGGDLWKDSPHCYEVSAWLGDWNLAADDHKNNHTKNILLRMKCVRQRTLSYLATISARSWSSFTAASCSVSDAGDKQRKKEKMSECQVSTAAKSGEEHYSLMIFFLKSLLQS